MDAESKLKIVEDLLGAEIEHLKKYNRLLEGGVDEGLASLLARYRDDEVRRVDALHERVRAYRVEIQGESA